MALKDKLRGLRGKAIKSSQRVMRDNYEKDSTLLESGTQVDTSSQGVESKPAKKYYQYRFFKIVLLVVLVLLVLMLTLRGCYNDRRDWIETGSRLEQGYHDTVDVNKYNKPLAEIIEKTLPTYAKGYTMVTDFSTPEGQVVLETLGLTENNLIEYAVYMAVDTDATFCSLIVRPNRVSYEATKRELEGYFKPLRSVENIDVVGMLVGNYLVVEVNGEPMDIAMAIQGYLPH